MNDTEKQAGIGGAEAGAHKSSISQPFPKALPPHVRSELEPRILQSVGRLEKLKMEKASLEDFDMALQIKNSLGKVYALLISYKECEQKMRNAAIEEDYKEASRLKIERDNAKVAASEALNEVEMEFIGNMNDLSLSTIRDESFVSQKSTHSITPYNPDNDQISIASKVKSPFRNDSHNMNTSSMSKKSFDARSIDDEEDKDDDSNVPHAHPLAGIDNADELPAPEEISKDIASDLVQRVEDLMGDYRTKCLFSKQWQLRDAVLAKMSLLLPELFTDDLSTEEYTEMTTTVATIVRLACEDSNVQVYQSGLVLLDELLLQCEQYELPQSKVTSLLANIVTDILTKLSDGSKKVGDSAELSLLAMAHSPCVGVGYICSVSTKKVRTADSKGGRAIKARLQFLDHLIAEVGEEVTMKRAIEFAKASKAFDHKDVGVREAAKALVLTLMMVHGDNLVLESLEDCTERQYNEYRAKHAAMIRSLNEQIAVM